MYIEAVSEVTGTRIRPRPMDRSGARIVAV
jgi:hypothetical protein